MGCGKLWNMFPRRKKKTLGKCNIFPTIVYGEKVAYKPATVKGGDIGVQALVPPFAGGIGACSLLLNYRHD